MARMTKTFTSVISKGENKLHADESDATFLFNIRARIAAVMRNDSTLSHSGRTYPGFFLRARESVKITLVEKVAGRSGVPLQ